MSNCKDKKCPKDKICNPKTGRCVLKEGKIGKQLLKSKSKRKSNKVDKCKGKKCPKDKICNPKTGRCVLKEGKIGKQLLKKSPTIVKKSNTKKKVKKESYCMKKDKIIFDSKYKLVLSGKEIHVLDKSKKIIKTYKNPKVIYSQPDIVVYKYSKGRDMIVLKKETTDSKIPTELIIYNKLRSHNCGTIRLRHLLTKRNDEDFTHYYIMDGFTGDLEDGREKIDPMVLGKELKKHITCLYTSFKPPLWYTDLKLANILYCENDKQKGLPGKIYLGDLGSLAKIDGEHIFTYPPPEHRLDDGFIKIKSVTQGKKVVSWSFGITILQACVKNVGMFHYSEIREKSNTVIRKNVQENLEKIKNKKIVEILTGLLEINPKKRKTLEEIKF